MKQVLKAIGWIILGIWLETSGEGQENQIIGAIQYLFGLGSVAIGIGIFMVLKK